MNGNLQTVMCHFDEESDHNLSQSRYQKQRKQWAVNAPCSNQLYSNACDREAYIPCVTCVRSIPEEAYVLPALLSYTRRYWRTSLSKKTQSPEAAQLQAICQPNARRARESCRKQKPGQGMRELVLSRMHVLRFACQVPGRWQATWMAQRQCPQT